jgi:YVTN family beta-propeller protein
MRFRFCLMPLVVLLAGCEILGDTTALVDLRNVEEIRYARHVQPLLNAACGQCHAGSAAAAGLRLDAWSHLMDGSAFGEAVVAFDPDRSRLIQMVTHRTGGPHPLEVGADTLSQVQIDFLKRWIAEGARNDDGEVPFAEPEGVLYVCNQLDATVSVIDQAAQVVIRIVDLQQHGFSANARPHHVVVEPDGAYWYVSLIGDNKVAKFDRENRLVATATLETPGMLALDPESDLLFASRSLTAVNPPTSIGAIRRSTMQVEERPVVFPRPHAMVVHNGYAYTASAGANQVIALKADTGETVFVAVDGPVQGFVQHAVSPDGTRMATAGQLSGQLLLFDLTHPQVPHLLQSVEVGRSPWHPHFTPDGQHVYVSNLGSNTVSLVEAATWTRVQDIIGPGLAEPHDTMISPDGRYVFVSNRNSTRAYTPRHDFGPGRADRGTLAVIDTQTNTVVKVLELGRFVTGIGMAGHEIGHGHGGTHP